eukprot:1158687-Pelagomonas_calceolata.AAC.17
MAALDASMASEGLGTLPKMRRCKHNALGFCSASSKPCLARAHTHTHTTHTHTGDIHTLIGTSGSSLQSGSSSSKARGSNAQPDRMWAPAGVKSNRTS